MTSNQLTECLKLEKIGEHRWLIVINKSIVYHIRYLNNIICR